MNEQTKNKPASGPADGRNSEMHRLDALSACIVPQCAQMCQASRCPALSHLEAQAQEALAKGDRQGFWLWKKEFLLVQANLFQGNGGER